ncbi:hypothetical protein GCM10009738_42380 [Kitasatospora viridis]
MPEPEGDKWTCLIRAAAQRDAAGRDGRSWIPPITEALVRAARRTSLRPPCGAARLHHPGARRDLPRPNQAPSAGQQYGAWLVRDAATRIHTPNSR